MLDASPAELALWARHFREHPPVCLLVEAALLPPDGTGEAGESPPDVQDEAVLQHVLRTHANG